MGCARILEAVRLVCPQARFYQASSSEMFGLCEEATQSEHTPFHPRSPYGAAKAYAHHMTVNYRESHGIFAVAGILFNHESERRGMEFVTRKIAAAVARIDGGDTRPLHLGDISARRDWGFAGDYTRAMTQMMSQDEPQDFVIATGRCWSVRDFLARAFQCANLDWEDHVVSDPSLIRPAEIPSLRGDASAAREKLSWTPTVTFDHLVSRMVESEIVAHQSR
jgi:GDPmannose 4,6-dehydratase